MTRMTAICCSRGLIALMTTLAFLGSITSAVASTSYHPHSDIIKQAKIFIEKNINHSQFTKVEINMGQLDRRLNLNKCTHPLQTNLSPGSQLSGKSTILVKCSSQKPWTVYIGAQIKLYKEAIATVRPLDRGHILTAQDLTPLETEITSLNQGYYNDKSSLIGQQLKRRLPQKRIIKANYITPPTMVKRGELVTIIAENTGFSVKMNGKALANGTKGDRIRVKNLSSKRVIEGTVMTHGVVNIH